MLANISKGTRKLLESQFTSTAFTINALPRTAGLLVVPMGFGKPLIPQLPPHSTYGWDISSGESVIHLF